MSITTLSPSILTPLTTGLFRYFQLKQLPNFMLATPIVFLALYTVWTITMQHRLWRTKDNQSNDSSSIDARSTTRTRASFNDEWYIPFAKIAHVLHLVVVMLVGVFLAHVQISTRLLCSSCPIIYLGMIQLQHKPDFIQDLFSLVQFCNYLYLNPYCDLLLTRNPYLIRRLSCLIRMSE